MLWDELGVVPAPPCLPTIATEKLACPGHTTGSGSSDKALCGTYRLLLVMTSPRCVHKRQRGLPQRPFYPCKPPRQSGVAPDTPRVHFPAWASCPCETSLNHTFVSDPPGRHRWRRPSRLSHPSIGPPETLPPGLWSVTEFPWVQSIHSTSTVKPQQLSRPTAQHGLFTAQHGLSEQVRHPAACQALC